MEHISLFNGIGGFMLAAQWMGWQNIAYCEIDEFCNQVTQYHFPHAKEHTDIRTTDFSIYRGKCDILTGGFPCQPFSVAGKQKGTEDERHLWPEMLRAIREIQPKWIVGENVLGIVNWSKGVVFEQVCIDLEAEGYEVQPYILPAASVNAPHRRYRVWFIAYSEGVRGCKGGRTTINDNRRETEKYKPERSEVWSRNKAVSGARFFTNPKCKRGREVLQNIQSKFTNGEVSYTFDEPGNWEEFPTQAPICDGDDGLSTRLDSTTFSKWRKESIKGGGNAIVPQVAFQIFKAIEEFNIRDKI